MVRKLSKAAFLPVLALLLCCLVGCPMYTAVAFKYAKAGGDPGGGGSLGDDPSGLTSSAAEVTLAWDPPPSSIQAYKLFFRIHDTSSWLSLIDNLPADPSPQYTVQHIAVGDGIFDFGVKAVNAEAAESNMHISVETTAQPDTGWYLVWEQ